MKRFALLILVLVCLSLTAFAADVPKGDVFGGFSINHVTTGTTTKVSTTSYGWQGSGAANLTPIVGIVGDFGGQYKTVGTTKNRNYQYLFGPRFNARMEKFTAFGEALWGGNHSSKGTVSSSQFAMGYGGGLDVMAGKVMVRVIQFDWIPTRTKTGTTTTWTKNNTRYGFGISVPLGTK